MQNRAKIPTTKLTPALDEMWVNGDGNAQVC